MNLLINKQIFVYFKLIFCVILLNVFCSFSLLANTDLNAPFSDFSESQYQQLLTENSNELLWIDGKQLSLNGRELQSLLDDLGFHFKAERYADTIKPTALLADNILYKKDLYLTSGIFKLLSFTPQKKDRETIMNRLSAAIAADNLDEFTISLTPQYDQVSLLRSAIAKLKLINHQQWPNLNINFRPKLGQSHPQVKSIRTALFLLGYLSVKSQTKSRSDVFDSVALDALKKFQRAHGLLVDGKLGPNTYAALKLTPEQRIQKLQINLQRWFLLPPELPEQYLIVNIPSYQLELFNNGNQELKMRVIVGDKKNQTPQMITEINRVTLNPTWTPTFNIIKNELVPEYKNDYLSLKRKNFQLVTGYRNNAKKMEIEQPNLNLIKMLRTHRLVQAPGDNNALGFYRFNIPNNFSIYLHDTPVKSLFSKHSRALSHGCVRLEKADVLANYLLKRQDLPTPENIQFALASGKTTHLPLNKSLPVFITYQTAWVDELGELQLLPDIYQLDQLNVPSAQFDATDSNPVITLSQNTP